MGAVSGALARMWGLAGMRGLPRVSRVAPPLLLPAGSRNRMAPMASSDRVSTHG